ncbi:MAG: hypothetical protein JNL40_04180 [Cyclobacteriaceae bacterium]|nr:hypothetical protein [Cyclobacteriaceae bacterium]
MVKRVAVGLVLLALPWLSNGQGFTRYTYHDAAKKNIKEIYQVKDTFQNVLHGSYVSYFLNGVIESKGQFNNNETSGVWEFYYETGKLRMRGMLRQNSNFGAWEYFYENGNKSMEGTVNGKNKEGEWKIYYESGELKEVGEYTANKRTGRWLTYFEDGSRRGETEYVDDHGRHTEYYHSGKVQGEGPRAGGRNVGHWRFFAEGGTLLSEGDFVNGKKTGSWKFYFPSGKVQTVGTYDNDRESGKWTYYYEDGTVSSSGEFSGGVKQGYWMTSGKDGKRKSEITYVDGAGEYREYYPDDKLKVKGRIVNGKNEGKWEYFSNKGTLEGNCEYKEGKGLYKGYYPTGTLQTKGQMEDGLRVGTWELYEPDGTLSGYYKPFYENNELSNEITSLIKKTKAATTPAPAARTVRRTGFYYFKPRYPEYRGVILGTNPMMTFVGRLPLAVEFYNQERLGHEFEFEAIRSPFYTADSEVPEGTTYQRGYSIALKQKFYNARKFGMWYFGHEVRLANVSYFNNVMLPQAPNALITVSASEQRAEYGIMLGARLMQRNNGDGLTIDASIGYNVGYRAFDVDPSAAQYFSSESTNNFAHSFRFVLNFGYSLSFDGRR